MKRYLHIIYIFTLMLMAGGALNQAWAAKVTYHILTLPIDPSVYDYHMKSGVTGYRLEAFKVVVDNQSTVELPAHYKSPLIANNGFTYYKPEDITGHGSSAVSLYDGVSSRKGVLYEVKASPTPVAEGTAITTNTAEYYVVYTYDEASNDGSIAKLDGSVNYNIGVKDKGFLSLNRGRNNRPAVIPTAKVDPEMLASPDFSYVDNPGNNIGTYWNDGNNRNTRDSTESKFYFIFKFEGKDPYHIVVRTSYARDYTFIEKNEDGDKTFVYKWYKGAALMTKTTGNAYLASDDHIRYKTVYNSANPNPTDLSSGYDSKTGYFHGNDQTWGTVALLNNTSNTGYVFMGTRTVDGNGVVPGPKDNTKYYYLTFNGYNNLNFGQITSTDATNKNTIDGIYPLKKVTFKIATPFYAADPSDDHIVSAPTEWVSQYTVDNDPIETKYLPSSLRRKYCNYTGKFYSDAACTNEITKFSDANYDNTEGYQVYIGYSLTSDIPFKGITPAATYTASTWAGATWYELTDEASTQADGLKLKYDGTNFKNNGADNDYAKTTEFAFIGDPYELRVVYRDATSGSTPYYVGAAGTPPTTETLLTTSTTDSEGYKWELPNDATAGSFLLRKYKGTGNWYWDAGHPSPVAIDYTDEGHASTYNVATANAQTVTFNVSNLTFEEGNYLDVTVGDTDAAQATVQSEKIYVYKTNTATFKVSIKGRGGDNKRFTLTIQEKKGSDDSNIGTEFVVTVNQNNSAIVENTVQYSTTNSTRVKVMTLPTRSFTYNIVDLAGNIAAKATATQTIYSPLSLLGSVPSVIISPLIMDENITFYRTFDNGSGAGTGTSRTHLSNAIIELTAGDAASTTNIYVAYETTRLANKSATLSENQVFNVRLNEYYVYYDASEDKLKKNETPTPENLSSNAYLWKLRNRDPYAMLIDNLGAREDLDPKVEGSESVTIYYPAGNGSSTTESREKGAWLKLAAVLPTTDAGTALTFDATRANAQRFIAKSSLQQGVYEVMVATNTVDASTTYYNIGSPDVNTVKIYNNSTYAHGHEVLKLILNQNINYTYHLIDKAKHQLLTVDSKNPDLVLPAEYQSPLVATYHFYDQDNITESEGVYTVKASPTELTSLSSLLATATEPAGSTAEAYNGADANHKHDDAVSTADITEKAKKLTVTGNHYFKIGDSYYVVNVTKACYYDIYVTYEANDIVKFNSGQYMLKFLDPYAAGYYLEDGNDKLTSSLIQAVYPYCNGDGSLNIYGSAMQNEQFGGGANTRPRWIWYFISDNSDPYHVRIRSKSTVKDAKNLTHNTFLTTYAVHFNQDTANDKIQRIVTGGTLPGVASTNPMEYMVLGSAGNYKLLSTQPVAADLNGDGDTDDTVDGVSENTRRYVTSFEQYWKTYNMVKLHVLGIDKDTDAYSTDESTWVVPTDPASYRTTIENRGWHSYETYANATRWNGYNDKSNGHEKKVVEKIEHWFQTFSMGNGTFDIESADVPPVLVLLDRHGWEIMRRPLPTTNYPEGEELAGLRVFDSPLVDRYYFYSNATKESGCHKYTMRLQNGAERDQVKVNGERYSSTSLGDLPPRSASGVVSGGAIQDLYVIYTVKEEYENNYAYSLDTLSSPYAESGISQPYLVLQNGRFYKSENTDNPNYISKPIIEHTNPEGGNVYDLIVSPHNHGGTNHNIIDGSGNFLGNNFWYVKPNLDIDDEMGIPWIRVTGEETETAAKNKLRKAYETKTGFDPYNIQLQLKNDKDGNPDGRYLTTHMTSARLDNGIMVGDYEGGSMKLTLAAAGSATVASGTSEGYDHTDMRITNQTFMAVSDANGNMQLMPRFDHTLRVNLEGTNPWETKLSEPVDHAKASVDNNSSMGPQTTFFVCPQRFHYHIIDNDGREALRYKRGADFYPTITSHFKSPFAKDFTYYTGLATKSGEITNSNSSAWGSATGVYKRTLTNESMLAGAVKRLPKAGTYYFKIGTGETFTYKTVTVTEALIEDSNSDEWGPATGDFKRTLTNESMLADAVKLLPTAGTYYYRIGTRGVFSYKKVTVTEGLSDKQITGSFAEADVEGVDCDVYVRYDYDLDADLDADRILQGQWYTVKLADNDLQADGKVMTFTRTAVSAEEYTSEKAALSSNGVYYFRKTYTTPYSYIKVTKDGGDIDEDDSDESAWTNALGLGVDLYAGETSSRSLTAVDATEYASKRDALTETGEYYFKIGTTEPYAYKKVEVTSVPIDEASDYAETADDGTFATLWSNSKPLVVDADAKKWQWKFFVAPADPTSDYYVKPDPYAIHLFNRYSNYTTNPSEEPSPMSVEIKVPNANDGADRFALLSHPSGGYALVVAKTYSDYNYSFLNGASMTTSVAATTATEAGFNYKTGGISNNSRVVVDNDVKHNYTYYVITNANNLAITAMPTAEESENHGYNPYVPEVAQSPLLNMDDYKYYGFASRPGGKYSVIPQTILYTLSGLYDDNVYVRYNAYDVDKTSFKVPNQKTTVEGIVARAASSVDASLNISGGLPYNIVWYNNNMMQSTDNSTVSDGGSHALSGTADYVWYFTGGDPYALKIKHKGGKYLSGTDKNLVVEGSAPTFMLLRKSGYDYGILQMTSDDDRLTFGDDDSNGETPNTTYLTTGDPTKYIIFGLSVHDLIYHLVIARTCKEAEKAEPESDQYVNIPYRETESGTLTTKTIWGTTQRDLKSVNTGVGTHYPGEKYQLGSTVDWYDASTEGAIGHTYSYHAGSVSIGDEFVLPNIFNRPNCTFEYYIEGIYQHYAEANANEGKPHTDLESKYKGLKLTKLMSDDQLIDQTVVVNIVYSFDKDVATNTGLGFVTSNAQNLWYTFETPEGETPYLAQYTNAWGLQAKPGRATRYTNDYLWTPLGDVYGFKMFNRYMIKNSNSETKVMTYPGEASDELNLLIAEPGTGSYTAGNEVFELLPGDMDGYFRVHPVVNTGEPKYYVRRGASDYAVLSTTPSDWTFGLDMILLEPYYERAGYIGGLNEAGKTAYETALAKDTIKIIDLQEVVYNYANIVHYTPGYYRLHSQPGVSGIDPVRYASGYLHKTELTGDDVHTTSAIPMHFYSKVGVTTTFAGEDGLGSGFTITNATRGEIPIDSTECDPSTIFYFNGTGTLEGNPRSTIQTQGLHIAANANGDANNGTTTSRQQRAVMSAAPGDSITFSLMDIGGAVLLIHDGSAPGTRRYLNFDQSDFFQRTATDDADMSAQAVKLPSTGTYYFKIGGSTYKKLTVTTAYISDPETNATYSAAVASTEAEWNAAADKYDLKYYHESPTDDAKWCMQPVQKTATVGNGELSLEIETHNGGDGYYYATFYAPFDVLLPADDDGKTYNAYICKTWENTGVHPVAVPAATVNAVSYVKGKFVPAATPVILRVKDERDTLTLTLPTTSPSSPITSCVLSGSYLDQLLAEDASHDVYTFGVPMKSNVESYNKNSGIIVAPLPEFETSGVGFYINATYNKESDPLRSLWQRNNRYVLHNKIYYRYPGGVSAPKRKGPLYVPVLFGDVLEFGNEDEVGKEEQFDSNAVYDLQGRRVVSGQSVIDGTWRESVTPGIYIYRGKKLYIK